MSTTKKSSAIHEAGHAIVACSLGAEVLAAVVYEDGGGWVKHTPTPPPGNAVIAVAGWMATDMAGLEACVSHTDAVGITKAANEFATHTSSASEPAIQFACNDRARKILADNWTRVLLLAGILERDGIATQDDIREVVGGMVMERSPTPEPMRYVTVYPDGTAQKAKRYVYCV